MPKHLLILLTTISASITGLYASENHFHTKDKYNSNSCESNEWMIAYQYGYTEIHPKDNHMSDDSGAFIGIHAMKPIENTLFNGNLYLAAGTHTTFTEDKHVGLMLGIMYSINERTTVSIMPGLMFMKHEASNTNMGMSMSHMSVADNKWEADEAIHIEISHTITLFSRILNPILSWMPSSSHNQYSFGFNFHF